MFSTVHELLEEEEELEETVNPSRFDGHYISGFGAVVALLGIAVGATFFSPYLLNWVTIGALTLAVFATVWFELKRRFVMYHFTSKKIVEERGVFNKDIYSVPYSHIIEVAIEQDFNERVFGLGDLHVKTAGTDSTELVLNGMRNPQKYKREIGERLDTGGVSPSQVGRADEGAGRSRQQTNQQTQSRRQLLQEELGDVELKKKRLQQQYEDGEIGEEQYRQRWYRLEGAEEEIIDQLESVERADDISGEEGRQQEVAEQESTSSGLVDRLLGLFR